MSMFSTVISSRSDLDWCWYLRKHGAVGEKLERVLHDVGVLQPGGWAPWSTSTLTDTGAPIEMIFSPNNNVMSLRTEVDNPSADPEGRVARVCDNIANLGQRPPPAGLREVISAAQSDSKLRFGAWLGLSICETHQNAMLYAEFPAQAADLARLVSSTDVTNCLRDLGTGARVHMLAFDCASGETTLYFEAAQDPAAILPMLAAAAGVPVAPLQTSVDNMLALGRSNACPPPNFGFSFTMPSNGAAPRLTLQFLAKNIFASDAVMTRMVRDYPGDHQATYAALADMLLPAPEGRMHHGTISLAARSEGCPQLSIGVAAPWVCPFFPL